MANIMDTLVTDRAYSDVKAQTEKGLYGVADLNRVEQAVEFMRGFLQSRGYTVGVVTKTDWTMASVPTLEEMTRYLANIQTIRDAAPVFPSTPRVPKDMDLLTYQDANNIEKILLDVYKLALNQSGFVVYSGMVYAGMLW